MYKKRHIVLSMVATAIIVFWGTRFVYTNFYIPNDSSILVKAKNIISENYVDKLSKEQTERMEDAAISAMVASLGDPYSRYLNANGFSEFKEENEEEYVGIGVSVSFNIEDETLIVTSPYEGSPAQKSGLLPGDIITAVDGVAVSAESYDSIIEHIRSGKKGESVLISIHRPSSEKELNISVMREVVNVESVVYKMFEDGIGYIRISQFIEHTTNDFKKALEELQTQNMEGLIIDLRSNPGGYAQTVLQIADMLLPEGTIAYLENNKGERQYFNSDANCIDLPMAVLINRGSASASELLAGSVQAYEAGILIGEKSFGKAVGQTPYLLNGTKTAIYLTNARYYTPKGECIDKKGIVPDIEVELADELLGRFTMLPVNEDTQLSRAIYEIKTQIGK